MLIKIKNLKLKTIIGVHKWEEVIDREIIINAAMTINCDKSLQSDDINDTLDYDLITTRIKNLVASNRYKLIEKMAQEIMNLIMEDARIVKCSLELDKVVAVENVDSFSITIEKIRV